MTPKQKLRVDVMISSTSIDLPKHRKLASDAISLHNLNPIGMEKLPASGRNAIDASYKLVDEAEVYVGVFGLRYGFIPDDPIRNPDKKSITELEYRRARERGIPMFCFLMDKGHDGPESAEEGETFYEQTEDGREKLKALKDEIGLISGVKWFKNPDMLNGQIYHALDAGIKDGTIKTEGDSPAPEPDAVLFPKPPTIYEPHPYRLTQKFFGRVGDLAVLDTWSASAEAVMVVEALGGVGKSALTYEWFTRHAADFDGALWWSFYENESSMRRFVRHALAYLLHKPIDAFKNDKDSDLEAQLLNLLTQKRVLVVFDGLERAMVAYHRLDAAQTSEDIAEDAEKSKDIAIRKLTDQREADLLRKLAAIGRSKLLISTRLNPSDLQDQTSDWAKGVTGHHLNGLQDPDALNLIRHYGVKGDSAKLSAFMKGFGNHCLLIKIVAGLVKDYYPARYDFDRWIEADGAHLKLTEMNIKQNRTNILATALRGLKPELAKLLSQIAAFRFPVDYAAVSAFNPYLPPRPIAVKKPSDEPFSLWMARYELENADTDEARAEAQAQVNAEEAKLAAEEAKLAEAKVIYQAYLKAVEEYPKSQAYREALTTFHKALRELEERGLVAWDRDANTYDLHPVVRAYAYESLGEDVRAETFDRIRTHFDGLPPEKLDEVTEVHQLHRSIEIYTALVRAGQLDRASDFYVSRLNNILQYQIAAYHTIVELLTPLFRDGLTHPPALSTPARQSARMTNLAGAFYYLGQTDKAQGLQEAALKLFLDQKDAANLAVGLLNYGNTLRGLNQRGRAEAVWGLALALAEAADDAESIAFGHQCLLVATSERGAWEQADQHYQAFMAKPPTYQAEYWTSEIERTYAEMLLARGMLDEAEATLERAWGLAVKSRHALGQRVILGLRGELALARGDAETALRHFNEAVRRARAASSGAISFYLGGLARASLAAGKQDEARKIVEEYLRENLYGEALDAAEVWLGLGEHEQAKARGLVAYTWAWADGPPYIRWSVLERAKKVLDALGVPHPALPPYDAAKQKPIIYEAEIRAYIKELRK